MGWVYAIECVPTGELYIGSTRGDPKVRFAAHRNSLRCSHSSPPRLQAAHDQHGMDALRFTILKEFPDAELAAREGEAIDKVKPALNVYTRMTQEVRDAMRGANVAEGTIWARARRGLTGSALVSPPHANKKRYEVRGEMLNAPEIAARYSLREGMVRSRIAQGFRGDDIIRKKGKRARSARAGLVAPPPPAAYTPISVRKHGRSFCGI